MAPGSRLLPGKDEAGALNRQLRVSNFGLALMRAMLYSRPIHCLEWIVLRGEEGR